MTLESETSGAAGAEAAPVREVVGVFHDEAVLEAAIDALQNHEIDRADISLLASEEAIVRKLGHAYRKVSELADEEAVARAAYVSREDYGAAEGGLIGGLFYVGALAGAGAVLASGGALAGVILAAALTGGAGGAAGLALARQLDKQRSRRLSEQLEKGGLLLWVHVRDEGQERSAADVLRAHGAEDVHAHVLAGPHGSGETWTPYPPLLTLVETFVRKPRLPTG